MKKPFHKVCICILAAFAILVLGVFIGRNTKNEGHFVSLFSSTQETKEANGLLDINSATVEQFQLIPGIGPVLAQKIVDYREENGPFRDVSELTNVDGIGSKTLQNIFKFVTVGGDYEDSGS